MHTVIPTSELIHLVVKIVCLNEDKQIVKEGSGTLYFHSSGVYVLTAAHCLKDKRGNWFETQYIHIYDGNHEEFCRIDSRLCPSDDEDVDCAVLRVLFTRNEDGYRSKFNICADIPIGADCLAAGYPKGVISPMGPPFESNGNDLYRLHGNNLSDTDNPEAFLQGMSGGGVFYRDQSNSLQLIGYMKALEDEEHNLYRMLSPSYFLRLIEGWEEQNPSPESPFLTELNNRANTKDKLAAKLHTFALARQTEYNAIANTFSNPRYYQKQEELLWGIIGADHIKDISSAELFVLYMSLHFADCGQVTAPWEVKTMELAEPKTLAELKQGRRKMETDEAYQMITPMLYEDYDEDHLKLFSPSDEDELLDQLSDILTDYWNFFNGYVNLLEEIKEEEEAKADELFRQKVNYIRRLYLDGHLAQQAKKNCLNMKHVCLGNDRMFFESLIIIVADICKVADNRLADITLLEKSRELQAGVSVNPQFCAELVRIVRGIIASDILDPKNYEPAYEVFCSNHEIHVNTVCQTPESYYRIHERIAVLEKEIDYYRNMQDHWGDTSVWKKVTLQNCKQEEFKYSDKFKPMLNSTFTLEQKKILELLMGVELYKDPYACLREIYQNSLDACRCRLGKSGYQGMIEFGMGEEKGQKYIYCLDNGIGMTEHIIQNYFLHIGRSYYKSDEFFRNKAEWGASFTPTSQFGIGVLSCFMIGTRIEVLTRRFDGERKLLKFVVEGLEEHFYYCTPERRDKQLSDGGTLIKIYLQPEFADKLNNRLVENYGFWLTNPGEDCEDITDEKHNYYFSLKHYPEWKQSLFGILSSFIIRKMDGVEVCVKLQDGNILPLVNRPFYLRIGECGITDEFVKLVDRKVQTKIQSQAQAKCIQGKVIFGGFELYYVFPITSDGYLMINGAFCGRGFRKACLIDGVIAGYEEKHLLSNLANNYQCLLTMSGANKPLLSVDRTRIVKVPMGFDFNSWQLFFAFIEDVYKQFVSCSDVDTNRCFEDFLDKILKVFNDENGPYNTSTIRNSFCEYLSNNRTPVTEYCPPMLENMLEKKVSLFDFMNAEEIEFYKFDLRYCSSFLLTIILEKIYSSYISNIELLSKGGGQVFKMIRLPFDGAASESYSFVNSMFPFVDEYVRIHHIGANIDSPIYTYPDCKSPLDYSRGSGPRFYTDGSCLATVYLAPYEADQRYKSMDGSELLKLIRYLPIEERQPLELEDYKSIIDNGCTLLVFPSMDNRYDISSRPDEIILPGKMARKDLVKAIPEHYWDQYPSLKDLTFSDGKSIMDYVDNGSVGNQE